MLALTTLTLLLLLFSRCFSWHSGSKCQLAYCLGVRDFPNKSEDMRLSSMATIPSFAATPGLHGERCRFNRASVTRDPTVCKKGPAIPEASDHFLVLVLILRASIPKATILATPSLRPSWLLVGTWRLVGSCFDCAAVAAVQHPLRPWLALRPAGQSRW